ncbi:hypothetical protein [Mycobacteroides chelonae]|nr:hypothetical protein [Mycobacteroides chelonae]AYM43816.1 hypothetical protein DYE20_21820 [[Mycobacterium] chelonae subsp. gwanakae]OHU15168.1 hypothetical protein BKG75_08390 [Mycobacteroides chelonae]GLE55614.1 hypothetical protein NJBCHELONAE_09250 [Mycobacteroides chelonae]
MNTPSKVAPATLSALLLVGAITLYTNVSTLQESYGPITVHGSASDQTRGRNNAISIRGAYSASALKHTFKDRSENFTERTQGQWIVLDVVYETLTTVQDHIMYLESDDLRIEATRSRAKLFNQPGIPERMTLVFDVPESPQSMSLVVRSLPGVKNADIGAARGWGIDTQLDINIPTSTLVHRDVIDLYEGKFPE